MQQKHLFLIGVPIAILLALAAAFLFIKPPTEPIKLPQPTSSSSPTPTPETQQKNTNPNHPLLELETPQDGQVVSSPLIISGQARGQWFFEATFPVVLTDWDGLIIAEGYATAEGEWMTENFVPFTAKLTFTANTSVNNRGSLILQKANPSGLPEHDDAYEITVFYE